LYFETPALDAEVRRRQAAGFVFRQRPTDRRCLWREAPLDDPAGNALCLYWAGEYWAGENRRHPPWRLRH
jgi:hydroxymethylpyrimidine/phosphomethylpyrimidine kinase